MSKSDAGRGRNPESVPIRRPPARTSRRRVQQIGVLAQDLLEERLRTGDASPTEVIAGLKLVAEAEEANVARIRAQTELLVAQREKAVAETLSGTMIEEAMEALSRYRGEDPREKL